MVDKTVQLKGTVAEGLGFFSQVSSTWDPGFEVKTIQLFFRIFLLCEYIQMRRESVVVSETVLFNFKIKLTEKVLLLSIVQGFIC
jgi:hypothetical protein